MRISRNLLMSFVMLAMTSCASTHEDVIDEQTIDLSIRNVMQGRRNDFETCFDVTAKRLKSENSKKAALSGGFQVSFAIDPIGGVLDAEVESGTSTLKNTEIEKCVLSVIRGLRFGKLGNYDRYNVTYPFQFN